MILSSLRCPRCGGHRLLGRSPPGILLVCAGCGLVTTGSEPSPPGAPVADAGIDNWRAGHRSDTQPLALGSSLPWINYP